MMTHDTSGTQKVSVADDANMPSGPPKSASPTGSLEPTLFDLPEPDEPQRALVASSQGGQKRKRTPRSRAIAPSNIADPCQADVTNDVLASAGKSRIVYVDPFTIEPEPFNGRGLAVFDPDTNRDLIDDMGIRGNTVPVRLRPNKKGTGWTCASGSRRVNVGRFIAASDPEFRVAAIVDETMTDAEAYALCLSDNHGRNAVTPMQRGREIKWAVAHLYGGDRGAYIRDHGIDASVVSRALNLVDLPEPILACAADREALPTVFAEKLAPRLKDKAERKVILMRAKALGDTQLQAPRLLDYLLTGDREAPPPDRRTAFYGSGRGRVQATVTVALNRSAVFKVPATLTLDSAQRAEMALFLKEQIDALILGDAD